MPKWVKQFLNKDSTYLTVEAVHHSFTKPFGLKYVPPPKYQYEGGHFVSDKEYQFTTTSMSTEKDYIKVTMPDKSEEYVEINSLEWSDLCTVMHYYIAGRPEPTVFSENVKFGSF